MNRFPSNRIRVEFEGPDVSQEVLYELFRPYGRLADITPPAPVPAGSLRFAVISYTRVKSAAIAVNTASYQTIIVVSLELIESSLLDSSMASRHLRTAETSS